VIGQPAQYWQRTALLHHGAGGAKDACGRFDRRGRHFDRAVQGLLGFAELSLLPEQRAFDSQHFG